MPTRPPVLLCLNLLPLIEGSMSYPTFNEPVLTMFSRTPLCQTSIHTQTSQASTQPPVQAPTTAAFQPVKRTMTNGSPAPTPANGTPGPSSPSTTVSSLAHPSPDTADASWAVVGKTGVSPNENISIAPKANPKKKYIYYNREGQRLDEALPPRDPAASQAIEQRMKKTGRNLCNHWHLNKGKCYNKGFCNFQHEPKLTQAETIALRYKTRSLPCKNRYCENMDCCKSDLHARC